MTATGTALADLWRGYADKVYGSYSPLYSELARTVAEDADLLALVGEGPPHAHDPNMLLAAMHYLVLGGLDHPIKSLYDDRDDVEPGAAETFRDACLSNRGALMEVMKARHIQTNECGRSAVLALGFAEASKKIGEPLSFVDAGASAGLNLLLDEYRLDYGPAGVLGAMESAVRVDCEIRAQSFVLPEVLPAIIERVGIDRSPVDLSDPDRRRWLLACVWPGTGRLARTAAALDLAADRRPDVREGDMVDDLPELLAGLPKGPVVVTTSWACSYLSVEARKALAGVIGDEGRRRPIAWVSADAPGVIDMFPTPEGTRDRELPSVLGLAVFDGSNTEASTLGIWHSHGAWFEPTGT